MIYSSAKAAKIRAIYHQRATRIALCAFGKYRRKKKIRSVKKENNKHDSKLKLINGPRALWYVCRCVWRILFDFNLSDVASVDQMSMIFSASLKILYTMCEKFKKISVYISENALLVNLNFHYKKSVHK